MKPSITYKIHRSKDGQFYVTKSARNSRVTWDTETYKAKSGAKRAIAKDAAYLAIEVTFEIKDES